MEKKSLQVTEQYILICMIEATPLQNLSLEMASFK